MNLRCLLMLVLLLPATILANEPLVFDSPEQQDRYQALTRELRCLVCQNQNLADSDAPLAHDLKREVLSMIKAGQSDLQIREFLVQRYGDFVLYRPPVNANTLLLWLAPLGLLLAGGVGLGLAIRRRAQDAPSTNPGADA